MKRRNFFSALLGVGVIPATATVKREPKPMTVKLQLEPLKPADIAKWVRLNQDGLRTEILKHV